MSRRTPMLPTTPEPRPAPGRSTRPARPSAVQGTLMVAEREIMTQVRSKSFLISTAVLLVLVLAGIILTSVLGDRLGGGDTKVAVVPETAAVVADVEGLEAVDAADADEARALVESEDVSAAVLPDDAADNPLGVVVVGLDSTPDGVLNALAVTPPVELLDDTGTPAGIRYIVSFVFGIAFFMAAMTFGSTIAQNTVQEKQSRIVEILLSSVPPRALLGGKILGNTVLAVGQIAAIAAVAVIGLVVTGQDDLLGLIGAPVAWFVLFFLVGFVLLAALFASAASLVSRVEDTGPVLTPVMMLVMIPYFGVIFFNDNALVLTIMSYVPFSAPVGMPVRLFVGEAAWWEPILSLVILAATAIAVTGVGAKIYSRSVLRTGRRVKLSEVLTKAA